MDENDQPTEECQPVPNLLLSMSMPGEQQLYHQELFSIGASSHLIQSRLKIDVTPIIAYTGYTPCWERATVT